MFGVGSSSSSFLSTIVVLVLDLDWSLASLSYCSCKERATAMSRLKKTRDTHPRNQLGHQLFKPNLGWKANRGEGYATKGRQEHSLKRAWGCVCVFFSTSYVLMARMCFQRVSNSVCGAEAVLLGKLHQLAFICNRTYHVVWMTLINHFS